MKEAQRFSFARFPSISLSKSRKVENESISALGSQRPHILSSTHYSNVDQRIRGWSGPCGCAAKVAIFLDRGLLSRLRCLHNKANPRKPVSDNHKECHVLIFFCADPLQEERKSLDHKHCLWPCRLFENVYIFLARSCKSKADINHKDIYYFNGLFRSIMGCTWSVRF